MATKCETVEWVTIDGIAYTTELEAILHDVQFAFKPAPPGVVDNRPPEQRIEVAKQLLEYASRRSVGTESPVEQLVDDVVKGFKQWR